MDESYYDHDYGYNTPFNGALLSRTPQPPPLTPDQLRERRVAQAKREAKSGRHQMLREVMNANPQASPDFIIAAAKQMLDYINDTAE